MEKTETQGKNDSILQQLEIYMCVSKEVHASDTQPSLKSQREDSQLLRWIQKNGGSDSRKSCIE